MAKQTKFNKSDFNQDKNNGKHISYFPKKNLLKGYYFDNVARVSFQNIFNLFEDFFKDMNLGRENFQIDEKDVRVFYGGSVGETISREMLFNFELKGGNNLVVVVVFDCDDKALLGINEAALVKEIYLIKD